MNIEVQVSWAKEHRWQGGECLRRLETPTYALWLVLAGAIDLRICDWQGPQPEWRVTAGKAFLAPAPCVRDVVAAKSTGAQWLTLGLTSTVTPPGGIDLMARIAPPFLWRPEPAEQESLALWMRACIAEAERQTNQADDLSRFMQQSLAGAVFGLIWRARFGADPDLFTRAARRHLPDWLSWLLQRIEDEPARSLAEWQPHLPVSSAQVRRIFHRYVGASPQTYLTARRLEAARSLLVQTDQSGGTIARAIGFESQAHFTRCFKRSLGKTPTQYRIDARQPQL
jgi:AraC-like DNA-binding protein